MTASGPAREEWATYTRDYLLEKYTDWDIMGNVPEEESDLEQWLKGYPPPQDALELLAEKLAFTGGERRRMLAAAGYHP